MRTILFCSVRFVGLLTARGWADGRVRVVSVPLGGTTPDAARDEHGVIHLVAVVSNDVYYATAADNGQSFTTPRRVNSAPATAQSGRFRGPALALGRASQVHVIWYTKAYQRQLPKDDWGVAFTHLDAARRNFEPTRNLNHRPSDNYSVAADAQGNVAVVWTAGGLFVNRSVDDGATFAPAVPLAGADPCECCATRTGFGSDGRLLVFYREKANNLRDMYLLTATGADVTRTRLSQTPWPINACPMTGSFLVRDGAHWLAAWETKRQVSFGRATEQTGLLPPGEIATPAAARPKRYPVALATPDGTMLVAWKDGTTLTWQLFNRAGQPDGNVQSVTSASPHRSAGVVARDGTFMLFP